MGTKKGRRDFDPHRPTTIMNPLLIEAGLVVHVLLHLQRTIDQMPQQYQWYRHAASVDDPHAILWHF